MVTVLCVFIENFFSENERDIDGRRKGMREEGKKDSGGGGVPLPLPYVFPLPCLIGTLQEDNRDSIS